MASRAGLTLRSSGLGGVFKSLTKSLKPASGNVPVVINAKVVGGGNDMQRLLLLLQHGTVPSRASAAQEITDQLEKFSISSIPEVWYLARDLCDYKVQPSIRRVVLKLMIQCIKQDDDAVSSRLMFFRDITLFCKVNDNRLDPEFDLFLKALRTLTKEGRDIHDLYIYDLEENWVIFVLRCFNVAAKHARDYSGDETPDEKNFYNLVKMIRYLTNCFKFNFRLMDEKVVSSTLSLVLKISSQTDNVKILSNCIELIKVCVLYGYIPSELLDEIVHFLCWSSFISDDLQELSWDALRLMCLEYTSLVLVAICNVLQDPTLLQQQGRNSTVLEEKSALKTHDSPLATAIGAMLMLEKVFVCIRSDKHCQESNREDMLQVLLRCLNMGIPIINSGFLRMFDKLFNADNYETTYPKDTKFTELFPFQYWYSSNISMFLILSTLEINSFQDESYWVSICSSLYKQYKDHELVAPKERLVQLFLRHPRHISREIVKFVLQFYTEEQTCTVLDPLWKENCRKLLNSFYYTNDGTSISPEIRIECLRTIKGSFETSMSIYDDYNVSKEIVIEIIQRSITENDQTLIGYIMEEYVLLFLKSSSIVLTRAILGSLSPLLQVKQEPERIKSIVSLGSFGSGPQISRLASVNSASELNDTVPKTNLLYFNSLAKTLSRSLLAVYSTNATKAGEIYTFVLDVVQFCLKLEQHQTVLILVKLLMRLRSTLEGYIYFTDIKDVEGLATTFRRNKTSQNFEPKESWWCFPESLDYLPDEYLDKPNRRWIVFESEASKVPSDGSSCLDIAPWFDIVITIFEEYYHWELYSYTWAHFCSQLSNMRLLEKQSTLIRRLQKTICDQLTLNLPRPLTIAKSIPVTKGEMQVAYIRTMSSLIGYHEGFSKAEEDQIVSSLLFALDSWEKTAIPCIHMLTICCYEIPMSLKKYLTAILTRIQTGVTSAFASSPTLEFLMSIIQVPPLTSNFTADEFKRVFAIAFKYIQYALDMKSRKTTSNPTEQASLLLSHGVDAEVDKQASTQATEITPIVNEYLLTVSYLAISKWFLKIKVTDRRQVSGFLIKNVVLCSGYNEGSTLDDRAIAFLDLVARFTYCDIPLKMTALSKPADPHLQTMCNKWIIGHSLISIDTNTISGDSTLCLRRPTGTSVFQVKLDPAMLPANLKTDNVLPRVLSSYFLLQLLRPLDEDSRNKPIALFDDIATERAINTFDRIPVVSHHKAGILYIGPNQKTEAEILGNAIGSPAYHKFLDGIGQLVRLNSSSSAYVGGLDRENGTDGEFAYVWSDHLSLLAFHTTTLMPNMVNDKVYAMKKRHIGNNHINVFFDDSGLPFNFNVIKSQFNFINIVISPHSVRGSPVRGNSAEFFKVKAYRRSGVPGIFSSTHYKLMSLDQLLDYVRNMVLMADRFAHVWHYMIDGKYTTNWELRVKHIATLKQKTEETHRNLQSEQERQEVTKSTFASTGETAGADMTQSFLQQLQVTSTAPTIIALGASKYDYVSGSDNKPYSLLEFNSYA